MKQVLNDLIIYRGNIQSIHWKIKGEGFLSIHKFTDKMYKEINEFLDRVVEKYIQKDIEIETNLKYAIENSSLEEVTATSIAVKDGINKLIIDGEIILVKIEGIKDDSKLGAMYVIIDELKDYLEKTLWILKKSL